MNVRNIKIHVSAAEIIEGRPTWLPYIGKDVCPLYNCLVNEHSYQTCGECNELLCRKFMELRDPAQSEEEFEKGIKDRLAVLKDV